MTPASVSEGHACLPPGVLRLELVNESGESTLTPWLVQRLLGRLRSLADRPPVVLLGRSSAFCQGADIGIACSQSVSESMPAFRDFLELLSQLETYGGVVVAVVEGEVIGGGVGLVAAADWVIARPDASFALPEVALGLVPAAVLPVLARRIGIRRARLLASGLRSIAAQAALPLGLVDELAEDPAFVAARHLRRFLKVDPIALGQLGRLCAHLETAGYAAEAERVFRGCLERTEVRARLGQIADCADADTLR